MQNENIDVADFVEARSKEVKAIEDSLAVSHKQSLLWQRLPHYKRRRNRNFDKRMKAKFTYRPKDRHFLRTHTFYAKRFFMLKLEKFSIPLRRRLKSSKYIYKSQHRGFVFDESFRGVWVYDKAKLIDEGHSICSFIDFLAGPVIQSIANEYEVIVDGDKVIVVGKELESSCIEKIECIITIMLGDRAKLADIPNCKIYWAPLDSSHLETAKIICRRSAVMNIFEVLVNRSFIPVCLEEIHRIALEKDVMTIYDNVESQLFEMIESGINQEIVAKYQRTPPAKRQKYDTDKLYLNKAKPEKYFIFILLKGVASSGAEILENGEVVGRVVRSAYKFGNGKCYGLGFISQGMKPDCSALICRNLGTDNIHSVQIDRFL